MTSAAKTFVFFFQSETIFKRTQQNNLQNFDLSQNRNETSFVCDVTWTGHGSVMTPSTVDGRSDGTSSVAVMFYPYTDLIRTFLVLPDPPGPNGGQTEPLGGHLENTVLVLRRVISLATPGFWFRTSFCCE